MPFDVWPHAHITKACGDIEPDEVVAFGDGQLGLAFKANEAPWSWSHLIDLASFEVIAADDEGAQPAGVVSLGTVWTIGFGPIAAILQHAPRAA